MIKNSKVSPTILKPRGNDYQSLDLKEKFQKYLSLDWDYTDGKADWLFAEVDGVPRKVLDLTGSYGINLLGHKNEALLSMISKNIESWSPAMVQASRKSVNEQLANRIRDLLKKETNIAHWAITWTNTGAETIEAAIKMSFVAFEKRLEKVMAEINYSINYIQWCLDNQQSRNLDKILENGESPNTIIERYRQQIESLKEVPCIMHLENSFHGKTLGALSILDNSLYKKGIPEAFKTIALSKDSTQIIDSFNSTLKTYQIIDSRKKRLVSKSFLPVTALFVEAIQGEGGIHELDSDLLRSLRSLCNQFSVLMIVDEIQSGLFRTGPMAALSNHEVSADAYCFGKALGGGIAKIGVLCCQNSAFPKDFSWMHSSSFAGDSFSANIALKVLDILEENQARIQKIKNDYLKQELLRLKKRFPNVIKAIRGRGHMLAIEFFEKTINTNYTSKYFKDMNLLGYWLASVFLNRENIRIFPTLSAPLSFRIEPSIYFDQEETEFMIQGISNFCEAVQRYDLDYLFGHIMEVNENSSINLLPEGVYSNIPPPHAAFFICHPVDIPHIKEIIKLTDQTPDNGLTDILVDLAEQQEFTIYHVDKLKNKKGEIIDVVFLGIPITSKAYYNNLRKGKKAIFVQKIQNAIDFANRHHAKVIGLGQFTSIISTNGLAVNPGNSILTTGNGYTVWLTLQAIHQACLVKNWNIEEKVLSIIGAAGNILSVLSTLLVEEVDKLILIHRRPINQSSKFRDSVVSILKEILKSDSKTQLIQSIKNRVFEKKWTIENNFLDIIKDELVSKFLIISTDIDWVTQSDIVIVGTNSTLPIIKNHMVKAETILVDVAVPSNVESQLIHRQDVLYLKGGMAALPSPEGEIQHLNSVILPFGAGQSYACMAETFGIALDGNWTENNTGDLTKSKILRIAKLMESQGFELDDFKRKDSY